MMKSQTDPDSVLDFDTKELSGSLPDRFASVVAEFPDRTAVKAGDESLSFRQLDQVSEQVAQGLRLRLGDETEPVAILVTPGLASVIALLGIVKAGKFYCALSPWDPAQATQAVLADLKPRLLITDTELKEQARLALPADCSLITLDKLAAPAAQVGLPAIPMGPLSRAAIFHTSGTTGEPKRIPFPHQILLNRAWLDNRMIGFRPNDRLIMLRGFMFSGSIADISSTLMNGAALHVYNVRQLGITGLADYLNRERITIFRPPIELLRYFLDTLSADAFFPSVRCLILNGDTLYKRDVERARQHFSEQVLIVHDLASTEAGVLSRMLIEPDTKLDSEIVPIGRVVSGKEILILDENRNILPPTHTGEICVRNRLKAEGEILWPEFTNVETIPDPEIPSGSIYPTGDLGRFRQDGLLEFLGRKDFQYKIRGYRVNTAAIVSRLIDLENVNHAVVTARQDPTGEKRLVAYLVTAPGKRPPIESLRAQLARNLPDYMVPAVFVFLERIPITENGKVDFKLLPEPDWSHPNFPSEPMPARDDTEQKLVVLWQEILGVERVGIRDDFFALGGHSLTGANLCLRIEKEFGIKLYPASLVQSNTVERLAQVLKQKSQTPRIVIPIQIGGSKPPIFLAPGNEGDTLYFRPLASRLGPDQPVYGLQATEPGTGMPAFEELGSMAAYYLQEMRSVQEKGPYYLAGHSFGGRLVFAIAQMLVAQGEQVNLLVLLDTYAPGRLPRASLIERLHIHTDNLRSLPAGQWPTYFRQGVNNMIVGLSALRWLRHLIRRLGLVPTDVASKNRIAARGYEYRRYPGKMDFFRVTDKPSFVQEDLVTGWQEYAAEVVFHEVPGNHANLLNEPNVIILADELKKCLLHAQNIRST